MAKIVINPDDLPDLGPMPPELRDRLVERFNTIIRERPEFLEQLRARLAQSEERDRTAI